MSLSGSVARLSSKPFQATQWSASTPRYRGYYWPTSTCRCCCSTVSTPVSVWPTSGTAHTLTRQRQSTAAPSPRRTTSRLIVIAVRPSTPSTTTKSHQATVSSNVTNSAMTNASVCIAYPVVKVQKVEVGERYIQVWAPDNGRVPFPSIITIWGGGTLWPINWRRRNGVPLRPITL